MFKDPDKQREAICLHCGKGLELVPGKVPKRFCSDAHRKAYKRANLVECGVVAGPPVAEPRTDGTKQPRTLTPDEAIEKACCSEGVTGGDMTTTKPKLDKKLLKAIDSILCYGFHGSQLDKYSDSWLEVPINEGDAKILQEFHKAVNDSN